MENQELYKKVEKRIAAKMGFLVHLTVYISVNILLALINFLTRPNHLWLIWYLAGWGIGIFFHWFSVFINSSVKMRERKRKMIENEIRRELAIK